MNNGKYGIVDYSDTPVLQCEYDEITQIHGNDMYVVTKSW